MSANLARSLLEQAPYAIACYNRRCLHYNLAAGAVYSKLRESAAPFSPAYEPYLIAALISFDMGRMLGSGAAYRYEIEAGGFATRLHAKLVEVRPHLEPLMRSNLADAEIEQHAPAIRQAYDRMASAGDGGLNDTGDEFHVGATKLLHFLNPEFFLIVDSNAARVLRKACDIHYSNTTQPGYSSARYIESLKAVQGLIARYGSVRFRHLEEGTPLARIFDKIAFGQSLLES